MRRPCPPRTHGPQHRECSDSRGSPPRQPPALTAPRLADNDLPIETFILDLEETMVEMMEYAEEQHHHIETQRLRRASM